MGEEGKSRNPIYIVPDLVEEIFLRLPLKPLLKFKSVSKQWRSILESRDFAEKRKKFQKKPKILAAGDHSESSRLKGDAEEEIDVVYIDSTDAATRPSMTCDGLVCLPVPGWVNVLNPSTGEFISFPSGPNTLTEPYANMLFKANWWNLFPGFCAMGFGKDKIDLNYKVVRMFFNPTVNCEILDVHIGEWRKLNPPPNRVDTRRRSVCANGSIYWLDLVKSCSILALDLHTEEFRNIRLAPIRTHRDRLANVQDRLAMVIHHGWKIVIWILDSQEKAWSTAYSIELDLCQVHYPRPRNVWFCPVAVSKEGNLFFCDNEKRLFKYYPKTNKLCCLSSDTCVISDFVENLVSLRLSSGPRISEYRSGFQYQDHVQGSQRIEKFGWIKKRITNILITTTLVSVVIFRCFSVSCRSRN